MTRDAMLRRIEELDGKLAELCRAVEQLPEAMEASQAGPVPEQEEAETAAQRSAVVKVVDKAKLRPMVTKSFEEMNIRGKPSGAENFQAMIAACGVRPEDNAFSRGIVELREE